MKKKIKNEIIKYILMNHYIRKNTTKRKNSALNPLCITVKKILELWKLKASAVFTSTEDHEEHSVILSQYISETLPTYRPVSDVGDYKRR